MLVFNALFSHSSCNGIICSISFENSQQTLMNWCVVSSVAEGIIVEQNFKFQLKLIYEAIFKIKTSNFLPCLKINGPMRSIAKTNRSDMKIDKIIIEVIIMYTTKYLFFSLTIDSKSFGPDFAAAVHFPIDSILFSPVRFFRFLFYSQHCGYLLPVQKYITNFSNVFLITPLTNAELLSFFFSLILRFRYVGVLIQ